MLTILKMIHIYIYNKRWNQNLREIEGKEKWISDLPRLSSDSREEEDEPENPLKMSPNPSLDDVSPKVLMWVWGLSELGFVRKEERRRNREGEEGGSDGEREREGPAMFAEIKRVLIVPIFLKFHPGPPKI